MSKKPSHKNRPTKESASNEAFDSTRRLIVKAGVFGVLGVVAWRAGLIRSLTEKDSLDAKPNADASGEVYKVPESDNWMDTIRLPEISIADKEIPLQNLKPKNVDPARLEVFYKRFEELKKEFLHDMDGLRNQPEREKRIFSFFSAFTQSYKVAVGDYEAEDFVYGSIKFDLFFQKINAALIGNGQFIDADYTKEFGARMMFHEAEKANTIQVEEGGISWEIPLVYLKNEIQVPAAPGAPPRLLNGQYNPVGHFAVVHPEGAYKQMKDAIVGYGVRAGRAGITPQPFDYEKSKSDTLRASIIHEGAHGMLFKRGIMFDYSHNDAIPNPKDIPMGSYILPGKIFQNTNLAELHELVAIGISFMNSGGFAPFIAYATGTNTETKNYRLAREVIWKELMNSPEFDPRMRAGLESEIRQQNSMNLNMIVGGINSMPLDALHKIGERMAKLGIHLLQQGQK